MSPNSPQAQGVTAEDIAQLEQLRDSTPFPSFREFYVRILAALRAGPQSEGEPFAWFFRHTGSGVEAVYCDKTQAAGARAIFGRDGGWVETLLYPALSVPPERERRDTERLDSVRDAVANVEFRDSRDLPFSLLDVAEDGFNDGIAAALAAIDAALSATEEARNDG
jgi:hypothetical protein